MFLMVLALAAGCSQRVSDRSASPAVAPATAATRVGGPIDREQAIELAKMGCQIRLTPQEEPHDVRARLVSWQEVRDKLGSAQGDTRRPEAEVWLVSMAGTWLLYGPPPPQGTPHVPVELRRCSVVIDAQTGDVIAVTNREF